MLFPFLPEKGLEKTLAIDIAQACAKAAVIITDVGHPFDITRQETLAQYAPIGIGD